MKHWMLLLFFGKNNISDFLCWQGLWAPGQWPIRWPQDSGQTLLMFCERERGCVTHSSTYSRAEEWERSHNAPGGGCDNYIGHTFWMYLAYRKILRCCIKPLLDEIINWFVGSGSSWYLLGFVWQSRCYVLTSQQCVEMSGLCCVTWLANAPQVCAASPCTEAICFRV